MSKKKESNMHNIWKCLAFWSIKKIFLLLVNNIWWRIRNCKMPTCSQYLAWTPVVYSGNNDWKIVFNIYYQNLYSIFWRKCQYICLITFQLFVFIKWFQETKKHLGQNVHEANCGSLWFYREYGIRNLRNNKNFTINPHQTGVSEYQMAHQRKSTI